jgi:hypothetical protein
MKNPLTTIFGALSAAGAALAAVPDLPQWLHISGLALGAVSVALLGFFATDAKPTPKITPVHGVALAAAVGVLACVGCTTARFGFGVDSPQFGKVNLDIGAATLGNAHLREVTTTNGTILTESSRATTATTTTTTNSTKATPQ